jgi:LysM repeat protein
MSASSAFHDTFGQAASGGYGRPASAASASRTASAGSTVTPGGPVASGSTSRARQAPLRLTRRGRFVFFGVPLILLAALILSLSGFLNAPAKASDSAAELSLTPTVSVTVQPGESLWAIAGSVAPDRDPRDVVADIVQLNNLDAARVLPGQTLFVPAK